MFTVGRLLTGHSATTIPSVCCCAVVLFLVAQLGRSLAGVSIDEASPVDDFSMGDDDDTRGKRSIRYVMGCNLSQGTYCLEITLSSSDVISPLTLSITTTSNKENIKQGQRKNKA